MGACGPKVYIVGAGPGDPELITLKGKKLLEQADLVVYAGSLVNPELLEFCKASCVKVNSHGKRLEEIVDLMSSEAKSGKLVVRLASGDPSLYGSLKEMKEELESKGVAVEVVPGVSSLFAGMATIREEFTVPDGPQSLVVTRLSGKTTVRPEESLERFAATGASIALFLSAHKMDEIKKRALKAGLPPETPVVIAYKASWPEERVVETTLGELRQVEDITQSAIIYILPGRLLKGKRSYLYGGKSTANQSKYADSVCIIPVSNAGEETAEKIKESFPNAEILRGKSLSERVESAWKAKQPIVFVGPLGVAVRLVSPFVKDKRSDPPVVVVDIAGSFSVSLIGGHHGANKLARRIASAIGAVPVITTGTEVLGLPSIEELAEERGLEILGGNTKSFNARVVNRKPVYSVGMGWRKDVSQKDIETALSHIEKYIGLDEVSVFAVPLFKRDAAKEVLLPLVGERSCVVAVPEEVISRFPSLSPSRAKDKLGLSGVAEPCALAVLPDGRLFLKKQVVGRVTFAIGVWDG